MVERKVEVSTDSDSETYYDMAGKGQCNVCYLLIEDIVKMCPQCSAIFCQKCIGLLRRDSCPCCRVHQTRHSYVRCRLAEEMVLELKLNQKNCKKHELKKSYYCTKISCMKAICPECFIEDHEGHEKKKLKDLYEEKMRLIDTAKIPLLQKQTEYQL